MSAKQATSVLIAVALASCALRPQSTADARDREILRFVGSSEAWAAFALDTEDYAPAGALPAASDPSRQTLLKLDAANSVAQSCGGVPPTRQPGQLKTAALAVVAALDWLIGEAVPWITDQIDATLQRDVDQYTKVWTTPAAPTDLYTVLASGTAGKFAPGQVAVTCLHYTRYSADSAKPSHLTVSADFVARVGYAPRLPEMLAIQPLRLYYRDFAAITPPSAAENGTKPEKSITITIAADSLFLSANGGRRQTGTLNGQVLSMRIEQPTKSDDVIYQVYQQSTGGTFFDTRPSSAPTLFVPLPPWDIGAAGAARHGAVEVTMTLKEAGNVPWLLQHAADLFHANKSALTKSLTTDVQAYAASLVKGSTPPSTAASP